jgi:hypothetical protein
VYETWVRNFDDEKCEERLLSNEMTFEKGDLLKAKQLQKGSEMEEIHGRMYDTSRIVEMNGERKFFIGVIWTQSDELRMFEAFPEVLVMDAKAKTNKYKHAYFAGVGVDSFWLNNTLFRAWVPNQTDETYTWMTTVGLPAIVPAKILKKVRSIFTDDDGVVNTGIEFLQQCEEIFEYAKAYLCGYHIVRNFHAEFGIGCKQKFGLRQSSTKYRKGGVIEWGHPWQQRCADAIYRMQLCESESEADACFKWISCYVKNTKDIARKSLRKQVLKFFIRKFKKRGQWVLAYRLRERTLDLKSTSRVEGEFSGVHTMKLSSKMGLQKGFHKLRFYADRRRVKKTRLCQEAVSKTSIKKSKVMTDDEWSFLDSILTPYYCRKVEAQAARAIVMKNQLVAASETQVSFKVWCEHNEDDLADNHQDEASDGSQSDSSDAGSVNSQASGSAKNDESEDESRSRKNPTSIIADSDSVKSDEISSCASEGVDDFRPFKWRRVRTVVCDLVEGTFLMKCDCGYMDRTCIICRHILCILREVLKNWGFKLQLWPRRLLKKFYYEVITTLKAVGGCDTVAFGNIPKEALMSFCSSVEPSSVGVPREGPVDVVHDNYCDNDLDFDTGTQNQPLGVLPQKISTNKKGKSHNDCVEKFTAIMHDLKGDRAGRSDFYDVMRQFQNQRGRGSVSARPGAPETERTRGISDKRKGTSKPKPKSNHPALLVAVKDGASKPKRRRDEEEEPIKSKKKRASNVVQDKKGYEGDDAIHHLTRHGAKPGWVLECYPNPKGVKNGERWFMIVENGLKITNSKGEPCIQCCVWMKTNSITERFGNEKEPCVIESVLACGPPNYFDDIEKTKKMTTASTDKPAPHSTTKAVTEVHALPAWQEVLVGWENAQGQLAPGSVKYVLQKKAKEVEHLTYMQLRKAMLNANVKGVAYATNKDDLILLMCKFNCMYRMSQDLPEIYPAPKPAAATAAVSNEDVLKFVQRNQVAAHTSDTSSSDSEAPISKGAYKLAVAAAAAAKLKVVHAPLCCTGTPKNDPLCTCDFCMSPPLPPCKKPSRK